MQLMGTRGTTILYGDDIETFIRQTPDSGRDTLIRKNTRNDDIFDAHVAENQPHIGSGEGTVGCFGENNFIILRNDLRNELGIFGIFGH